MVKIILRLLLLSLLLAHLSCQKEGAGCFKGAGEVVIEEREGGDIRYIEIFDDPDMILNQKSKDCKILVETGENLLEGIITDVSGNALTIRNNNTCNWMRSFDTPIKVYVDVMSLDSIVYRGTGDVITANTLINDSIQVDIWEGSGRIDLNVEVFKSKFYIHEGTADLFVKGSCWINFLSSKAYGPADLSQYTTQFTYMYSSSPNNCIVRSVQLLAVTIENTGNVYYLGDPRIEAAITGEGKVIRLE